MAPFAGIARTAVQEMIRTLVAQIMISIIGNGGMDRLFGGNGENIFSGGKGKGPCLTDPAKTT